MLRLIMFVSTVLFSTSAAAAGGSNYSMSFNLGLINSSQSQMNQLIKTANQREGGVSTSELNSAYELSAQFMYRFSGSIFAMALRPSFFYQNQSGTGPNGKHEYGLTGFTVFPMLRLYPLENNFMKFFMQFGLGYGRAMGSIEENGASHQGEVKFGGGSFGTLMGLGAEFCFTPSHCVTLEGNYRYLNYERNLVSSSSGTFNTAGGSLSQYGVNQELEVDSADLSVRMSGLLFNFGYTFWF